MRFDEPHRRPSASEEPHCTCHTRVLERTDSEDSNVSFVTQDIDRTILDEQPEQNALASGGILPGRSIESDVIVLCQGNQTSYRVLRGVFENEAHEIARIHAAMTVDDPEPVRNRRLRSRGISYGNVRTLRRLREGSG